MDYRIIFCLIIVGILPLQVLGQMEREQAKIVEPVETFWTPTLISQATTEQPQARNLNVTIMHSFGIATSNTIQNFFGLDNVQNVRLGLNYGITERWSAGIGRSSLFNVVDLRSKYGILQQKTDGSFPFNLALKGDLGVITQENRRPFS